MNPGQLGMLQAHLLLDGTVEGTIYERITNMLVHCTRTYRLLSNHLYNLRLEGLFSERVICSNVLKLGSISSYEYPCQELEREVQGTMRRKKKLKI